MTPGFEQISLKEAALCRGTPSAGALNVAAHNVVTELEPWEGFRPFRTFGRLGMEKLVLL
jgi:hypothetical protein